MKPANRKTAGYAMRILVCMLAISLLAGGILPGCAFMKNEGETPAPTEPLPTEPPTSVWQTGYVATLDLETNYYSAQDQLLGTLSRGAQLPFQTVANGKTKVLVGNKIGYLPATASIVPDLSLIIPAHTLYVKSAVNLRDAEGHVLSPLADKGAAVNVVGYDYLLEDGTAHMYKVECGGEEGYILPWYLVNAEADATLNYDNGYYSRHEGRGNLYGGGGAANLDYFPREKGPIEGNIMPDECRTLYIAAWCLGNVDSYLSIANKSGINAFVVDIMDGTSIGYASDVMKEYSPTAAKYAGNSVEKYQAAIQKLKDAGYYVIGRITAFNDSFFVQDHPECAITTNTGSPMKLSGAYWPTPYNRTAWQYKVDLAVEAVELMGFNEIQFDYVRFPDLTYKYEKAGTIDFHNTYGETKAQAIQRFLMYAADILREHGAYVSADVFGETAYNYVTAYGQYWPAISNVVDAISGMPYPDHFSASGDWLPWEHPYTTLNNWGKSVMSRQAETATPAAVRTWIQAYNAIRAPYNTYGAKEVADQIKGLRDAGCTGGYMTWNAGSSVSKYNSLISAFAAP